MRYSTNECKLIKIIIQGKDTLFPGRVIIKVEMPVDFVPNKKWYKEEIIKYHVGKCESWLRSNGFIKDNNGKFSIYHSGSSKTVKIPTFFYNRDEKDLYVGFNNIMGISLLAFAVDVKISKMGLKIIPEYDSYRNFPRKTDSRVNIETVKGRWNDIEYDFYNENVIHNGPNIADSKEGILGNYDRLLFKYIAINDRDQFDTFKWPKGFKESITEKDWNWVESTIVHEKYQL